MITARKYQADAIDAARAMLRAGKRAPLLCAPPGAGKTTIGALICASRIAKGGRAGWVAHRKELVTQARTTLQRTGAPHDRYTVTTYQKIVHSGEMPEADLVVLDECHWLGQANESWRRVPETYLTAGATLVGLSATPERGDGSALAGFDCIVPVSSYSELIALGKLVPCNVVSIGSTLRAGQIIASPVDAYLDKTPGSVAVVFGPTVDSCERFAEDFRAKGVPCEVVHATSADRVGILERWRTRKTLVVCNVGVLTEGFDYPAIETVIIARVIGTCGLYLQMTGRGLRESPGKSSMTLIDLVGAANVHGAPDADRTYSLDGIGIKLAGAEMPPGSLCRICSMPVPCGCPAAEPVDVSVVGGVGDLKPWQAAMREEPADKRIARLSKWIRDAEAKGHKATAAKWKFKAVYGHFPTSQLWEASLPTRSVG